MKVAEIALLGIASGIGFETALALPCEAANSSAACQEGCIWFNNACKPSCSAYDSPSAASDCPAYCIFWRNKKCMSCPDGHIPDSNQRECVRCEAGSYASGGYAYHREGYCNATHIGEDKDRTPSSQGFMGLTLAECQQICADDYHNCKYVAFTKEDPYAHAVNASGLHCLLYSACPGETPAHFAYIWDLYELQSTSTSCHRCDAGWVPTAEQTKCLRCEDGSVAAAGDRNCTVCGDGSVPNANRDSCRPCENGTYSIQGSTECQTCRPGAVPNAAQSECLRCTPDSYSIPGNTTCVRCPTGYVPNSVKNACEACSAGKIANPDNGRCEYCPRPGQVPNPGGEYCIDCEAGFSAQIGQVECKMCDSDTYSEAGSALCKPCPGGAFSGKGSDSCSLWWPILLAGVLFIILLVAGCVAWKKRDRLKMAMTKKPMAQQEEREPQSEPRSDIEAPRNPPASPPVEDGGGDSNYPSFQEKKDTPEPASGESEANQVQVPASPSGVGVAMHNMTEDHPLTKEESLSLGITLDFILHTFKSEVTGRLPKKEWRMHDADGCPYTFGGFVMKRKGSIVDVKNEWENAPTAAPPTNPTFVQMVAVIAYGLLGLGKGYVCPRDRQLDSSIVDAVYNLGHSAVATHLISWVWTYDLELVLESLYHWSMHEFARNPTLNSKKVSIWWCFFANNQYRILQDEMNSAVDGLGTTLEQRLKKVNGMIILMDAAQASKYSERIWCIFEICLATQQSIPCSVAMPEKARGECKKRWQQATNEYLIDANKATATLNSDEEAIKGLLIERYGSLDQVNSIVGQELRSRVLGVKDRLDNVVAI